MHWSLSLVCCIWTSISVTSEVEDDVDGVAAEEEEDDDDGFSKDDHWARDDMVATDDHRRSDW